jgi:hypothetical protein
VSTLARPWLPGVAFGRALPQETRLTLHLQHQVDALYQVVYLLGRRMSQLLVGEQLLVGGKHFFPSLVSVISDAHAMAAHNKEQYLLQGFESRIVGYDHHRRTNTFEKEVEADVQGSLDIEALCCLLQLGA